MMRDNDFVYYGLGALLTAYFFFVAVREQNVGRWIWSIPVGLTMVFVGTVARAPVWVSAVGGAMAFPGMVAWFVIMRFNLYERWRAPKRWRGRQDTYGKHVRIQRETKEVVQSPTRHIEYPPMVPAAEWLSRKQAAEALHSPALVIRYLIMQGALQEAATENDIRGVSRASVDQEIAWRREATRRQRVKRHLRLLAGLK